MLKNNNTTQTEGFMNFLMAVQSPGSPDGVTHGGKKQKQKQTKKTTQAELGRNGAPAAPKHGGAMRRRRALIPSPSVRSD